MDMTVIQSTISSIKLAGDIAKSLLEFKTFSDASGKISELNTALMVAQINAIQSQSAQFTMILEIRELKEEIASIKAWEAEKSRYQLKALWNGFLAYAVKEIMNNGEPAHYICTKCYEDKRRSFLELIRKHNGRRLEEFIICQHCKNEAPYQLGEEFIPQYA